MVVVDVDPSTGACALVTTSDWTDALFDLTWSEARPDVVVAGGGDGSVIVWDFAVGSVWDVIMLRRVVYWIYIKMFAYGCELDPTVVGPFF